MPNFHWRGEFYSVCLGIFFGKRFDHHGLIETQGLFCLPAYDSIPTVTRGNLGPFDSKPRIDLEIALNLTLLAQIEDLLYLPSGQALETFFTAGSFYQRSLRLVEEQPEVAYLDLVTCGEILSNYFEFSDKELFDEDLLSLFDEIRSTLPDGDKKANQVRSRMFQVKRRFSKSLFGLLNENFFSKTEALVAYASFEPGKLDSTIRAAYDLRSRYVHTGERFGVWTSSMEQIRAERQFGTPVVDDPDYKKILIKSPTFVGLERIMRYCLIRFVHKHLCPVDVRLD